MKKPLKFAIWILKKAQFAEYQSRLAPAPPITWEEYEERIRGVYEVADKLYVEVLAVEATIDEVESELREMGLPWTSAGVSAAIARLSESEKA